MLFWLCLIILIIGIALIIIGNIEWYDFFHEPKDRIKLKKFLYVKSDSFRCFGWITTLISGFIMLIMIVCITSVYIQANARVEKLKETYNALTYKVESDACRDEFGLLNKEIIDEIQEWNEDITYSKNIQRNFWIGIFIPNVYDQFETIDYTKYGRE